MLDNNAAEYLAMSLHAHTEMMGALASALSVHSNTMRDFIECTNFAVQSDREQFGVSEKTANALSIIAANVETLEKIASDLSRMQC